VGRVRPQRTDAALIVNGENEVQVRTALFPVCVQFGPKCEREVRLICC
jgi:hypothetical protein